MWFYESGAQLQTNHAPVSILMITECYDVSALLLIYSNLDKHKITLQSNVTKMDSSADFWKVFKELFTHFILVSAFGGS